MSDNPLRYLTGLLTSCNTRRLALGCPSPVINLQIKHLLMEQKIERKGRNPRITVCFTPEEYKKIVDNAAACGLKKSQFIHDTSLGQEPKVMMSDKEADALISLKAARGELILIKNALHGTTQEQRKKYFRNEQFMKQWIEGVNSLIRRLVEIEGMFKR
jgi:CRISPR/Cas system-associated protein Csx1